MARHFERKLRVYCAAGSAAATMLATASHSQAQIYKSYFSHDVGGNDSGSIDASDANEQSFLNIGDDAVDGNHQLGTDGNNHAGAHLYVTNNKLNNKANYLYVGNSGSGALANLTLGTLFGSSNQPTGTMFENGLTGTDNDIAYTDSSTGTVFTPQVNSGSTATQFSILTPGYYGFSFTPTGSSTLDYGYAQIVFDSSGDVSGSLVYNTTGAAVTVATLPVSNWAASGSGDFANASNWIGGIPGGVDYEADFGNFANNSGGASVNVSSGVVLGTVRFFNKYVPYTLSGVGSLNMNSSTGNALIVDEQGNQTINIPVNFISNGALNVSTGSSTATNSLTLNAPLTFNNGGTIHVGTAGTLTVTGATTVASGKTLNVIIDGFYGQPYGVITLGTVNVSSGATAAFSYNYAAGADAITMSNLILGNNSTATLSSLNNGSGSQGKLVLQLGGISLAPTSKIDLTANDLDFQNNPSLTSITALVAKGYNHGNWNGAGGITSSTVTADTTHLTALGVIENSTDGFTSIYGNGPLGQFDNQNPSATDVLVRYTYYGDANLDGQVDGSDYSLIDNGFTSQLTGWYNGDFNYDGVVDGSDYTLIDNAFNMQQANLVGSPAGPTAMIANTAVPEPASLSLLALGAVGLLRRKRV